MGRKKGVSQGNKLSKYMQKKPKKRKATAWDMFSLENPNELPRQREETLVSY
jgi:hypothetical protein